MTLLFFVGSVATGWHYAVDGYAGLLLALVCWWGVRRSDPDPEPSPEVVVVRRERDERVLAALGRLRPEDQELLRLALWEELPHAEIAALLGCSRDAATHRIHRATRRVAKEYQRLDRGHAPTGTSQQSGGGEPG